MGEDEDCAFTYGVKRTYDEHGFQCAKPEYCLVLGHHHKCLKHKTELFKQQNTHYGGGGGWNTIIYQILDSLKSNIRYHTPQNKSDITRSQKSDSWLKK